MPFAHFLKKYFASNKKYGSKDRKQITDLCYNYLRLGKSYEFYSIEEKILKGLQLSGSLVQGALSTVASNHKLPQENPDNIFSFKEELSKGIDREKFIASHLIQPDLFLRIRPGGTKIAFSKLEEEKIAYHTDGNAIRLQNNFKAETIFNINKDVVVQDLSSQRVAGLLEIFKSQIPKPASKISVWDCCAASGGKSILAKDVLGDITLLVSDTRTSIIANLKKRFAEAEIKNYQTLIADATTVNPQKKFDFIIADVPCTGSGTWGRTPEQLVFFEESCVDDYARLQSKITGNIIKFLKPGGCLLYITCSVFKKENENQVQLLQNQKLQIIEQLLLPGYDKKADTMFCALFKNPNL